MIKQDKRIGVLYTKKLNLSEIAFILDTQFDIPDGGHKYLGMPLSEPNHELIADHKKTKGFLMYQKARKLQEQNLVKLRVKNKGLEALINFNQELKKTTDRFRNPVKLGIGSLPNPFASLMPREMTPQNYDEDGDFISNIQPVGHKRRPTLGIGVTGYMTTRKLDNPVDISKAWLKDFGLTITGFKNIKYLCKEMNVTHGDAFKYICEGMNKNPKRYRHHRITMEMFRGSLAVVDLIDFYNSKRAEHKSKNKYKFTQEQLYHSPQFKEFSKLHGIEFATFKTFHAWWLEINKLHKAEAVKRPKGLLD